MDALQQPANERHQRTRFEIGLANLDEIHPSASGGSHLPAQGVSERGRRRPDGGAKAPTIGHQAENHG
jgi:hypothetical protein